MTPASPWFSTSAAIELVGNHLWQSTLFAAVAGLLTLALGKSRAQVRYWLWLAASVKFLIPFAALMAIGSQFGWRPPAALPQPQLTFVMDAVSQPFSQPGFWVAAGALPATASSRVETALPIVLLAIWFCGCAAILLIWCARWRRVAAAVRHGSPVEEGREVDTLRRLEQVGGVNKPIAIVSSNGSFEPGVFGIVKPVLLWPRSIGERLGDEQIEAILKHELSHVHRRDNFAAAVHMFVEATFWFHPLVWWVGARMVDERERACDEAVIRWGTEPHVYAESILKTCQFYVESPLGCVAGVTGSDLKKRIERIMSNRAGATLSAWRKVLLATAGIVAIAGPIAVGAVNAPRLQAQSPATGASPTFEVASVKPNKSGDNHVMIQGRPNGQFTATNLTLRMLISNAYQLQDSQLLGGPGWLSSDRFDILAKADANLPPGPGPGQGPGPIQLMIRALLADRFKLTVHSESRELPIYALVMARSDGKLGPQLRPAAADCAALAAARGRGPGPVGPSGPGGPGGPSGAGGPGRGPDGPPPPGERPTCGMRIGPGNLAGGGIALPQLANSLSSFVNRVVQDRTGLVGIFDLDLQWTPEQLPQLPPGVERPAFLPPIDPNGPSIFTALQEQLGLKLDSQKGPVDVLVIDHVEQPTED